MKIMYLPVIPVASSAVSTSPTIPQGHFSAVTSLSLSPDGWLLLSGGRDKVRSGWCFRVKGYLPSPSTPISLSPSHLPPSPLRWCTCGISAPAPSSPPSQSTRPSRGSLRCRPGRRQRHSPAWPRRYRQYTPPRARGGRGRRHSAASSSRQLGIRGVCGCGGPTRPLASMRRCDK